MSNISIDPNGPLGYLVEQQKPKGPDNSMGKDTFLKLLVAQMKYQNPMDPSDSTAFIAQTAQFTLVEQMAKLTSSNDAMLQSQLSTSAAAMVGKHVQWRAADGDDLDAPTEGDCQGVRITADGPILLIDGWEVALNRVTAFGVAPTAPAPPDTTTDTTDTTDTSTDAVDETTDTTDTTSDTTTDTTTTDTTDTTTDAVEDTTDDTTPVTDDTTTDPVTDPVTTDPQTDPAAAPAA
jgi:flagellar basal-body rod modification protein FlgD